MIVNPFFFSRVFIGRKLCLVSLFLVYCLVIQHRYCWEIYFFNNFNLFNDSRRGWWRFIIIDNIIPEQNVYVFWWDIIFKNSINIYHFHMVHLAISFSEYLFFLPQAFLLIHLISLSWTSSLLAASILFAGF